MNRSLVKIIIATTFILLVSCKPDSKEQIGFFQQQSKITNPGKFGYLYDDLPNEIDQIVEILQGLMVHGGWIKSYDKNLIADTLKFGFFMRKSEDILQSINSIDTNSLTIKRPLEERLIVNCRTFAVMLCSILRDKKIPARVRAGYATYFNDYYENHWICEYWDRESDSWIKVDAQLDSLQKNILEIQFNTLNIPEGFFLSAGEAWKLCRQDKIDSDKIGVTGKGEFYHLGYKMLIQQVLGDFRALNKFELLPWDTNPFWDKEFEELTRNDLVFIDSIANIITYENIDIELIENIYKNDKRTKMSNDWSL
jgi:excinuclease ABC subunit A